MPLIYPSITITISNTKALSVPLTAEQLRGIFEQCDKNGDGRLDRAELKEAFKKLGAMIPSWRAARGLHHADLNGDGYIDEEEMTDLVNYALRLGYTVK
ncbi:hypothetical protein ACH5RR_027234 [Cinchona calisaya]|uniref:EF-hand domain-containing protein n=1 Tax=Cinchona calisaya TaxID=153742 RepID=A0ABD2Z8S6_9GENT